MWKFNVKKYKGNIIQLASAQMPYFVSNDLLILNEDLFMVALEKLKYDTTYF